MEIEQILEKYKLQKEKDCWKHPQSGYWICYHDTCKKIADIENIFTKDIQCLHSTEVSVRLLVTMIQLDKESGKPMRQEISIGEASKENVRMQGGYLGCMAEKRGKDRGILRLIGAYDILKSEEESEEWEIKNLGFIAPSEKQVEYLLSLCVSKKIDNSKWDMKEISKEKCGELINDLKTNKGQNVDEILKS